MQNDRVRSTRPVRRRTGYTLVEISITLAIVGILAAVSGSQYLAYLDRARTARAIAELHAIADTISPGGDEDATYPATLADAGISVLDPWGNPYQYLLIEGNLPKGLAARGEELPPVAAAPSGVDQAPTGASTPSAGTTTGSTSGSTGSAGSTTAGTTSGSTGSATTGGNGSSSGSAGSTGAGGASSGVGAGGNAGGASNAGGAGNAGGGQGSGGKPAGAGSGRGQGRGGKPAIASARKDRFQVPINSDFDLYSMGPDGRSMVPLNAPVSRDDIIRANDGAFYGIAEEF